MQKVAGLICIWVVGFLLGGVQAHAADVNGDGVSDIPLLSIQSDSSLSWTSYSSSTGEAVSGPVTLGENGNHIILGNWTSPTHAQLGVIRKSGKSVLWEILQADNSLKQKKFGSASATVISGADFDGNGYGDAATVQVGSDNKLIWKVKRNLFFKPKKTKTVTFGKSSDVAFFANRTGKRDWLALLRSKGGGKYQLIFKDLITGKQKKVTVAGLPSDLERPVPLRSSSEAGSTDNVLLYEKGSSAVSLTVLSITGALVSKVDIASSGDVLVGNYGIGQGDEVAVQKDDGFTIFNPISAESSELLLPDGIAVDEVNVNKFTASGDDDDGGSDSTCGSSSTNKSPPAGLANVCDRICSMFDKTILYKQEAGGISKSDPRYGKPLILWYGPHSYNQGIDQVGVYTSNGTQISVFGFYNVGQPLVRFYSGWDPGLSHSKNDLSDLAVAQVGKSEVYFFTKNGNCWGPVDPRKRTGGKD